MKKQISKTDKEESLAVSFSYLSSVIEFRNYFII
jgi:hypothetical protein